MGGFFLISHPPIKKKNSEFITLFFDYACIEYLQKEKNLSYNLYQNLNVVNIRIGDNKKYNSQAIKELNKK